MVLCSSIVAYVNSSSLLLLGRAAQETRARATNRPLNRSSRFLPGSGCRDHCPHERDEMRALCAAGAKEPVTIREPDRERARI